MPMTVEDALRECNPHPADEEVLVTPDPDALIAIRHEFVKAVIWNREIPSGLQDFMEKTPLSDMRELSESWMFPLVYCDDERQAYPPGYIFPPLIEDMLFLAEILHQSGGQPLTRGGYLLTREPLFHIDNSRGKPVRRSVRLHTSYSKDMALEWAPGRISVTDYFNKSRTPPEITEFTKMNDVILFKGGNGNHAVPDGFMRGLMHRGQNAKKANAEKNSIALALVNLNPA